MMETILKKGEVHSTMVQHQLEALEELVEVRTRALKILTQQEGLLNARVLSRIDLRKNDKPQ